MDVLKGAIKTINKYKPIIYVEIDLKNILKVEEFFKNNNYKRERQVKDTNYLYVPV